MNYALIFSVLGTICLWYSLKNISIIGLLLFWLGVNLLIISIAYVIRKPKIFGNKPDGSLAKLSMIFFLPYLLLNWSIWHLQTKLTQDAYCHQIIPGIWLGRRLDYQDLPANITLIVDLTAEFPEYKQVIIKNSYVCLPILDGFVPSPAEFANLLTSIYNYTGGNIYIHCALGHGRSAMVVAAILLNQGLVDDLEQAEVFMQKIRHGVKLNKRQKKFLQQYLNKAITNW